MTTKVSELRPIACVPGVQPSSDSTPLATEHWTFADKIRFVDGIPQKIGGWQISQFTGTTEAYGVVRSIFSYTVAGKVRTILGSDKRLYDYTGSTLTNITPLDTDTIAIANSLATHYNTLANNPISTVSGSNSVTIADAAAADYRVGDIITISGATATGGVGTPDLNTAHRIRTIGVSSYTVTVPTTASSTATGGGASVIRTSGLVTVTDATHGMANGQRVKISGASAFGGIDALEINLEFIIRSVTTNTFDVVTDDVATSSVTAAGGAGTEYQQEIASGRRDASIGQGYGMGRYGVGRYGVTKTSTGGLKYPRIWFLDHFGETLIATPGNQTGVYSWDGDLLVAPTLVANAPTEINYAFISDNILVTFGAGGIVNKIFASDQNDIEQWTASSTNQVFEDNVETDGRLLTHVRVNGINLIFTETSCHTFRYIGLPLVWEIKEKDTSIGIIGPMARVCVNDIGYWMGQGNFYMWRGGNVEIIPANTQKQSTILDYVFNNLNTAQKSKCFAWYNRRFNEVWFHYPSGTSIDCDAIARVSLSDYSWTPDTMDRAAAEYPDILLVNPRLSEIQGENSVLYKHEIGTDANTESLAWSLSTNLRNLGRDTVSQVGVIPDSTQDDAINLHIDAYLFPQSTVKTFTNDYTIDETSERIPMAINGRYWMYTLSGDELGQFWRLGDWQEYVQKGPGN